MDTQLDERPAPEAGVPGGSDRRGSNDGGCLCPLCGSVVSLPGVHLADRFVVNDNKSVLLTRREVAVFGVLFKERPRVVCRERLYHACIAGLLTEADWPDTKMVEVYICHLRKKLAPIGLVITTVYGEGYRLLDGSR